MKIFGFFFFITLAYIAAYVLFDQLDLQPEEHVQRVWAEMYLNTLRLCMVYAPLAAVRAAGERPWVRALFIPWFFITALTLFSCMIWLLFPAGEHRNHLVLFFNLCVRWGSYVAIICLMGGSFFLRISTVRTEFRWFACCSLVGILFNYLPFTTLEQYFSVSLTLLRFFCFLPAYVVLLLIDYRLWKRDPGAGGWEAAVEKLGEAEA